MAELNKECTVNTVIDCKVETSPTLLAEYGNVKIFRVKTSLRRNSGVYDYFYVNYSNELGIILNKGDFIKINGDIRTVNKGNTDFVVECFISAKTITKLDAEPEVYENCTEIKNAELHNFLETRKSFDDSDKVVANYDVKLTRKHSKFSYFKVTSWGSDAILLGNLHDSIKYLDIKCRLQSHISKSGNKLYLCLASYHLDIEKPSTKKDTEDNASETEVSDLVENKDVTEETNEVESN